MAIAKEILYINGVVAALPGNCVTDEAVKTYGWEDKVESSKPKTQQRSAKAKAADTTQ